nr:hypothetical protein [Candidatus Paceibacterota bacterium]
GMSIVFILSGFVTALLGIAILVEFKLIEITQAKIDYFRENYGGMSTVILVGMFCLIILIAANEARKK